jgi:hypothetical protein
VIKIGGEVDLRHVKEPYGHEEEPVVSVSKIQSGHFSPKSPDCLPDGSLIRIEQILVRAVSRSLTTECTVTDQETFGMKSQKKEALAHLGL